MPKVQVVFYRETNGTVPMIDWLETLQPQVRAKCRAWLTQLRDQGHELRRPIADYLRDGVYELRVRIRRSNYRMLYFFHGREVVVVSHGLVKERVVPPKEIELVIHRRNQFAKNPIGHTYVEEL